MTISGFSYVRNGFEYGYPFLEAIQSILPICDEFVVAVGDSTDKTREAIEKLNSPKIKIIDTIWDMNLREGGKIFAQQANIALDNTTGDWAFHIQADEVIHEKDLPVITDSQSEQFFRMGAPVRGFGKAAKSLLDARKHVFRLAWRIMQGDVLIEFLKVSCCVGGQKNDEGHQRLLRRSRRRWITTAAGSTLPASICRLPRARIFRRAMVSWVCS